MHRDARRRQCVGHVSYVLTSAGIRDLWEVAKRPQLTTRERDSLRLVLAEIESSHAEEGPWTTRPLRQLTQDETRLSPGERAMLALAVAELEQIRRPAKPPRRRIR